MPDSPVTFVRTLKPLSRPWLPAGLILTLVAVLPSVACAERIMMPLDGTWSIGDSVEPDAMPAEFAHRVPVPGLAHLADPPLQNVDGFDSRELLFRRVQLKRLGLRADGPGELAREGVAGIPRQERNYLWYRRTFRPSARKQVAILRIAKAQFGTAAYLNGRKIGENSSCFTAGFFDLTDAIDWNGENTLTVRVGAHPGVLPDTYPTGTDFEKLRWTPGIYDRVELRLCDNPVIQRVQVAPRLETSEIVIQTHLKNCSAKPVEFKLTHRVRAWKTEQTVATADPKPMQLDAGGSTVVEQRVAIPDPVLWTPDNPFLYVVDTLTGGDSATTRFGMREFHFDPKTGKAMLNGQVWYLRGSSITLHRFFEDPASGRLPWDEKWVRRLLVDVPRSLHWNSFRFCIGPVPERWLEIADEAGLLIQNEYFIWTARPSKQYFRHWDEAELVRQYCDWVRDNWNHPSLVIWDSCNETHAAVFGEKVIPAARKLDLSNRPWENGYNLPAVPGDPVEDHPYLFIRAGMHDDKFEMTQLETMDGKRRRGDQYPAIINEYDWLWLRRDGTPTVATEKLYPKYLGPNATSEQRFALNAYLLAGLTEFWRAHRHHAGVQHYGYLIYDQPLGYTCDHFIDVGKLTLEPHFADWVSESFKPLGVYINFWQPKLAAGAERKFVVLMINDRHQPVEGELTLTLEDAAGKIVAQAEQPFAMKALGQQRHELTLKVPDDAKGKHLLRATATPRGKWPAGPTVSRRKLQITADDGK